MTSVTLDGLEEEQFRRSIEAQLRHGRATQAIERLRRLLAPYAGPGGILPERFLTVSAAELELAGWDRLGEALERHDRPERPVTAVSLAFGWPGEEACPPDANGQLAPYVEVAFYSDESFPFSRSTREDLLEGYSYHGCTWAGDCVGTESTVTLSGIDDLHGALATLEAELLASTEPEEDKIKAGSLAACLLSALLFQAVGNRIASDRLPRPLCVTAGSNGVYPYFDAPVAGMPEDLVRSAKSAEEDLLLDTGVPGPRFSSLLMTSIPRAKKRAVLVLEENKDEMAQRIASLRGQPGDEHAAPPPDEGVEPVIAPAPNGPLLVKKTAKPAREFADAGDWGDSGSLLTLTAPPVLDAPVHEEADDAIEAPAIEAPVAAAPVAAAPVTYGTQERLQLLVAKHVVADRTVPKPLAPLPAVPELPEARDPDDQPAPPASPVLRFDADWTANDNPAVPVEAPITGRLAGVLAGLRSRVMGWIGRS